MGVWSLIGLWIRCLCLVLFTLKIIVLRVMLVTQLKLIIFLMPMASGVGMMLDMEIQQLLAVGLTLQMFNIIVRLMVILLGLFMGMILRGMLGARV